MFILNSCETKSSNNLVTHTNPLKKNITTPLFIKDSLDNEIMVKKKIPYDNKVNFILDKLNDTLWTYINGLKVYDTKIPNSEIYKKIISQGFDIDTNDHYFYSKKRLFNTRLNIQFNLENTDTILTYIKLWYNGRPYERLFSKWRNKSD